MADKKIFNSRDSQLIKKMLTGGLAVGGATGLAVSLANYLKTLNAERASTSDDDDVLYVTLPPSKDKTASIGGGVALTAGGLGTLASYAAVRKLYQNLKQKRYQALLDQAQLGYIDAVDAEAGDDEPKQAAEGGKSMGVLEFLTSLPWAAPLVLGLGSGVVAHKLLDDAYPTNKKTETNKLRPKRIVLRSRHGEEIKPTAVEKDDPESTDAQDKELRGKEASFPITYDLDDGAEFLLHLVTHAEKSASDLPDLVHAIASGRHAELESAALNGMDFALETVKGASASTTSPVARELAHILAVKSAGLGPSVKVLAAAEYSNMASGLVKLASTLPEHIKEALTGIVCTYGVMLRKEASADILKELQIEDNTSPEQELGVPELRVPDLLQRAIEQVQQPQQQPDGAISEEAESGLSLEKDTEESSEGNPGVSPDSEKDDAIDELLSGEDVAGKEEAIPKF